MTKNSIIIVIVLIVLIGVGIFLTQKQPTSQNGVTESPSVSSGIQNPNEVVSNELQVAITSRLEAFGKTLQKVSLLAPKATLATTMQTQYGQYITPELLAAWQRDPSQALGRTVSSPWPDRIEVQRVTKLSDASYKAEGQVIEVTSADAPGTPAALYPVTFTLEQRGDALLISGVIKGAYSELPQQITVNGIWECLPHKDTSGPQTMECAFGIKADTTGKHYALNMNNFSNGGATNFATGAHIKVTGTMVPANQLNTNMWQIYPIEGIISVTNISTI